MLPHDTDADIAYLESDMNKTLRVLQTRFGQRGKVPHCDLERWAVDPDGDTMGKCMGVLK